MLGGVKEANYFIAFVDYFDTKSHDTSQLYHAHSCDIIVINTRPQLCLTMIPHW